MALTTEADHPYLTSAVELAAPAQRADADLAFALDTLPDLSSRITRMYVYQWAGDPYPLFDSGLTDYTKPIAMGTAESRYALRSSHATFKRFSTSSNPPDPTG